MIKSSESNIRQYELGFRNPKIVNIRKISKALGVYISDLIDEWSEYSNDEVKRD
ncbi:helix-turn-helix domain-containing protein [[Clostridium] innocuum]|uniref:helix-turn-helix domain-containing protein n=1 Tax=Clostridium innocuum TaxID=1522 RepID=UPI000D6C3AFE